MSFFNPLLTVYFEMFISTKAGIGAMVCGVYCISWSNVFLSETRTVTEYVRVVCLWTLNIWHHANKGGDYSEEAGLE